MAGTIAEEGPELPLHICGLPMHRIFDGPVTELVVMGRMGWVPMIGTPERADWKNSRHRNVVIKCSHHEVTLPRDCSAIRHKHFGPRNSLDSIYSGPPPRQDSAADVRFLLDAPAGEYGFVVSHNGHLFLPNGQPFRCWGVNDAGWTEGSALLPPHKDAEVMANELARIGVNCVRFQFLDLLDRHQISLGAFTTRPRRSLRYQRRSRKNGPDAGWCVDLSPARRGDCQEDDCAHLFGAADQREHARR